jgi:hypothetical protein
LKKNNDTHADGVVHKLLVFEAHSAGSGHSSVPGLQTTRAADISKACSILRETAKDDSRGRRTGKRGEIAHTLAGYQLRHHATEGQIPATTPTLSYTKIMTLI